MKFNSNLPFLPPAIALLLTALIGVIYVIIAIAFAVAVHRDANERLYRQQPLVFVGPLLWSLATLVTGGLLGGGLYWLMHHSTLSKPTTPSA